MLFPKKYKGARYRQRFDPLPILPKLLAGESEVVRRANQASRLWQITLAIHHALRTSERATQFIGRFQTAPRLTRAGTARPKWIGTVVEAFETLGYCSHPESTYTAE